MSMKIPEIKLLPELIRPYLGPNAKVVDHKIEFLTSPGENYGSIIVSVDVTVLEDTEKVVSLVAKLNPLNDFIQNFFQTQITFKKEIFFYSDAVPALINFQKEQNVPQNRLLDVFPNCYGARISLNPKRDSVDEDAVILLENLKIPGYYTVDRFTGFDLEQSKLIVQSLAHMHAVFVGLRILRPNEFKEKVLPSLTNVCIASVMMEEGPVNRAVNACRERLTSYGFDNECVDKADALLRKGYNFWKNKDTPKEPFASIVHNDCWVNNVMIRENDGRIVGIKFIDYQTQYYGSPLNDFIFFLFTSMNDSVLHNNLDDLIDLYYKSFIETLEEVKCDTAAFSESVFKKEVDEAARKEFSHIVFMLRPIFAIKGTVKDVTEFSLDDLFDDSTLSDRYDVKFRDTVKIYVDKGWL